MRSDILVIRVNFIIGQKFLENYVRNLYEKAGVDQVLTFLFESIPFSTRPIHGSVWLLAPRESSSVYDIFVTIGNVSHAL